MGPPGWQPSDNDGPDAPLSSDEMFGGRRRLRRAIVLGAVLAFTVLVFAFVTMMR